MTKKTLLAIIILLLPAALKLAALDVRQLIIVPPQEKYLYGRPSRSINLYSALGRQVFRSMQKSVILFNKSHISRNKRIALRNYGFAEASCQYNSKIASFYACVNDPANNKNCLKQIMDDCNCRIAIWFTFTGSYRGFVRRNSRKNLSVQARINIFNGITHDYRYVTLTYRWRSKSFSADSRNMVANTILEMLTKNF